MMDENEIKANYFDIYTDIFKLLENFERVQRPTNDVVGKFLGTALVAGMTLSDIEMLVAIKETLNTIVDKFFGEIPLTDLTIAEIKSAVDEQKFTSEIINKFFEDSKPGDIATKISDIDKYVRDRDQLKIRSLLIPFFFNKEANRIMTDNEIKANYLDIYADNFKLKEDLKNVQKPINDVVGKFLGTHLWQA